MSAVLRRGEGDSYEVRVSLAGVSNWTYGLGTFDQETARSVPTDLLPPAERITRSTPLGEFGLVAPPVRLSETPPSWRGPLLVPRGSSQPRWLETVTV